MSRWLMVAVIGVIGTSLLRGDGPASVNFNLGLEGWDPNQFFIAQTNTDNTSGFQSGLGDPGACPSDNCDPRIKLNLGGDATPVGQFFSFSADADGGGTFDFMNEGPTITNLLITTSFNADEQNLFFTCSSDEFEFCGFKDPDNQLFILFSNPVNGGIVSAPTPEPAQYPLLIIALLAGVVAYRRRSRRSAA